MRRDAGIAAVATILVVDARIDAAELAADLAVAGETGSPAAVTGTAFEVLIAVAVLRRADGFTLARVRVEEGIVRAPIDALQTALN